MVSYHGGQAVKDGFYLRRSSWKLECVAKRGGILPGDERTRYVKLPMPVVGVAGPLIGLAYVISLPFLFSLVIVYYLACWVGRTLKIAR